MDTTAFSGIFQNISQRVVFSYLNALSEVVYLPEGISPEQRTGMEESQRDLQAFFRCFYETMFNSPELFGLPVSEDCFIAETEPNEKDKKQEVKAKLKKPKEIITQGLSFLFQAGKDGRLEGQDLVLSLEDCAGYVQRSKTGKKFLQGLETVGMPVIQTGNAVILHSTRFPAMMAALKSLAEHCAQYTGEKERWAMFLFARCDFGVLREDYLPDALDLYRIFTPAEFERVAELHAFFIQKNYKPEIQINDSFSWVVKYQGNKKIKATALFQVEYQDRYRRTLRMQIKCASTNRLADLIPQQSRLLQDDFFKRAFRCRGSECNWCRNQKTLGPSVILQDGVPQTLCWYTMSEVEELNENTVTIIQQYHFLHDQLINAN